MSSGVSGRKRLLWDAIMYFGLVMVTASWGLLMYSVVYLPGLFLGVGVTCVVLAYLRFHEDFVTREEKE